MALSRFFQELFGGSRPRSGNARANPRSPEPQAPAAAIPFDYSDSRIPDASRGAIDAVLALIADIEAAAAADATWHPMLFEIRQISEVHLPKLIGSYIDIPAAHRAEIFRTTGRSASFLLNDGLEKLAVRLRTMSRSQAQGNIDAFASAMHFIDMRYGANPILPD